MEHWRQTSIPSVKAKDEEVSRSTHVLTVTSGNVQAYALDTEDGIENQDPASNTALERDAFKASSSHYRAQLHASNHQQANLNHLNARRQRHGNGPTHGTRPLPNPSRPYLTCKKYLAYRNRQRFEAGKDGAPVWNSVTEDAFQDGNKPRKCTDIG